MGWIGRVYILCEDVLGVVVLEVYFGWFVKGDIVSFVVYYLYEFRFCEEDISDGVWDDESVWKNIFIVDLIYIGWLFVSDVIW